MQEHYYYLFYVLYHLNHIEFIIPVFPEYMNMLALLLFFNTLSENSVIINSANISYSFQGVIFASNLNFSQLLQLRIYIRSAFLHILGKCTVSAESLACKNVKCAASHLAGAACEQYIWHMTRA